MIKTLNNRVGFFLLANARLLKLIIITVTDKSLNICVLLTIVFVKVKYIDGRMDFAGTGGLWLIR